MRTIKRIIAAQKVNMGGHILDQAIPLRGVDQIDPFLLLHYWVEDMPGGQHQKDVGVGPHPHRGFAPVSFIFEGSIHHRDSNGESHVVGPRGTQWMHSGAGIVHSERPSKELAEKGGKMEFVQIWINTNSANKMTQSFYLPKEADEVPRWTTEGKDIILYSGKLNGEEGPVKYGTPLTTIMIHFKKGEKHVFDIPENQNLFTFQADGKFLVNGETESKAKDLVWFNNDGGKIELEALEDTKALIFAGEPINENVETYGPFVMNTRKELMTAVNDYQNGKMGMLNEQFD